MDSQCQRCTAKPSNIWIIWKKHTAVLAAEEHDFKMSIRKSIEKHGNAWKRKLQAFVCYMYSARGLRLIPPSFSYTSQRAQRIGWYAFWVRGHHSGLGCTVALPCVCIGNLVCGLPLVDPFLFHLIDIVVHFGAKWSKKTKIILADENLVCHLVKQIFLKFSQKTVLQSDQWYGRNLIFHSTPYKLFERHYVQAIFSYGQTAKRYSHGHVMRDGGWPISLKISMDFLYWK